MYFLENKRVKLLVQVCLLHEKNESAIIKEPQVYLKLFYEGLLPVLLQDSGTEKQ